jgi:hypothetical protein
VPVIERLATPLFVKIGGGLILSLLVALGISVMLYKGERRHSAKLQTRVIESEAMLSVQNAHVQKLQAEGEAIRAKVDAARSEGLREIDTARTVKERLRNVAPANCPTPPAILEADI